MKIYKRRMYCEPLRTHEQNKELIKNFEIEREQEFKEIYQTSGKIFGLSEYLKNLAWDDDFNNNTRVYLIKTYFTNEIIGYFALKAGMISVIPEDRNLQMELSAKKQGYKLVPDTLSGIEISHFAINDAYRKKHNNIKNLGSYLYPTFIYPIIKKVAQDIGVKIIYLYAADSSPERKLVNYYQNTFQFNTVEEDNKKDLHPVTSYYDSGCIFMYSFLE